MCRKVRKVCRTLDNTCKPIEILGAGLVSPFQIDSVTSNALLTKRAILAFGPLDQCTIEYCLMADQLISHLRSCPCNDIGKPALHISVLFGGLNAEQDLFNTYIDIIAS